jgi:hypothetical protein
MFVIKNLPWHLCYQNWFWFVQASGLSGAWGPLLDFLQCVFSNNMIVLWWGQTSGISEEIIMKWSLGQILALVLLRKRLCDFPSLQIVTREPSDLFPPQGCQVSLGPRLYAAPDLALTALFQAWRHQFPSFQCKRWWFHRDERPEEVNGMKIAKFPGD